MSIKRLYLITILCYLFGYWQNLEGQIIDTIRERCITQKNSVNDNINIISRMVVTAKQPQRVTKKGKKIKNGYDTYYIHVIRAREVWIKVTKVKQDSSIIYDVQKYFVYHGLEPSYLDSAKISNRNNVPIYLAIATKTKKLSDFKTHFTSNALFLKGMIDNADSLIRFHDNELKNTNYLKKKLTEWSKQKTNLYPSIENEIEKLIKERDQLRGGVDVQDEDTLVAQANKKHKKNTEQDSSQVNQQKEKKENPPQTALEKKKQEEKQKKEAEKKKKQEEKKKKKEAKRKKKNSKKKPKKEKDTTHKTVKDSSKIWKREYKKLDKQQKKQGFKPSKESRIEQKIRNKNALIKEFEALRKNVEWIVINDYDLEKEDSLILLAINEKLYRTHLHLKQQEEDLKLYKDFKASKGKDKKLLKFFLSHYYAVSFKYTIRTNPYDLPKFIPEEVNQKGITQADQNKHKVKRGFFNKLLFWKK